MSKLAERKNDGKAEYGLIPLWLLEGLARRLGAGADVYSPWNWTKGQSVTEVIGSALRHLSAFQSGETIDPDPKMKGTEHIDAVIFNLLMIKNTMAEFPELDDRPKRIVHKSGVVYDEKAVLDPFDNLMLEIPQDLRDFLLKEKVMKQYLDNYNNFSEDSKNINKIMSAFSWKLTPEGFDFWNDLDNKFDYGK